MSNRTLAAKIPGQSLWNMAQHHPVDVKPIPAFYCCYLLRSSTRHSSLYVGSTPNPRRRLAQHNGDAKGGAVRTSRHSLRPWEMICIVAGFPSNIAALQFEWAWQNAHLTRHIPQAERVSIATTRTTSSAKTGKAKKRPGRPKASLCNTLANVHLLLRADYFSKWPLELRFFSEDVYRFWQAWCQRIDSHIPPGINVWLDTPRQNRSLLGSADNAVTEDWQNGGLEKIATAYGPLRAILEKAQFLIAEGEILKCSLCKTQLDLGRCLVTVCPGSNCESVHHMTCLSSHFLENESTSTLVPTTGKCPGCGTLLYWVDLMKELTLRIRGEEEVRRILTRSRQGTPTGMPEPSLRSMRELGNCHPIDVDEDQIMAAENMQHFNDDSVSVTSFDSDSSPPATTRAVAESAIDTELSTVIEDSDTNTNNSLGFSSRS